METKTKNEYLSLAEHFLATHFSDSSITPGVIAKTLIKIAPEYRPAYWRRLKRALAVHQIENGYPVAAKKIQSLVNPTTVACSDLPKKAKQRRVKSVSHDEHKKLVAHLKAAEDIPCLAAVMAVYITGCRPAEISSISLLGHQCIEITGAKRIEDIRGCDRTLKLSHEGYRMLELLLPHIQHDSDGKTSDISRIQRRLQRHVRKVWPNRKYHLSLYSYRHQLGAMLKASHLEKAEIAGIMGHLSISSVDVYGDRRNSRLMYQPEIKLMRGKPYALKS